MPKLRGHEFYLKAKEIRPSLSDRFIFITGFTADPHMALFFNRYEVNLLGKPFSIQVLIDCVRQLLCQHVTSLTRTENVRKTPHLVKRVIQCSRRDADDIRFAEIAFHAGGLEYLEQFFWIFTRQDRQLAPARVRVSGRNH